MDDLTFEIRRQHEQYVEVLQNKEDEISLERNKTSEMMVQLADRESVIRCLELEATDYRAQIASLKTMI